MILFREMKKKKIKKEVKRVSEFGGFVIGFI